MTASWGDDRSSLWITGWACYTLRGLGKRYKKESQESLSHCVADLEMARENRIKRLKGRTHDSEDGRWSHVGGNINKQTPWESGDIQTPLLLQAAALFAASSTREWTWAWIPEEGSSSRQQPPTQPQGRTYSASPEEPGGGSPVPFPVHWARFSH